MITVRDIAERCSRKTQIQIIDLEQEMHPTLVEFQAQYRNSISENVLDMHALIFSAEENAVLQIFVRKDYTRHVRTARELQDALADDDVVNIMLEENITDEPDGYSSFVLKDGEIKNLDLNGYFIETRGESASGLDEVSALCTEDESTLSVHDSVGTGGIICESKAKLSTALAARGTSFIDLYGGIYDVSPRHNDGIGYTLFATGQSRINVRGGIFLNDDCRYFGGRKSHILYVQDMAGISCFGGLFESEPPEEKFLGEGCETLHISPTGLWDAAYAVKSSGESHG